MFIYFIFSSILSVLIFVRNFGLKYNKIVKVLFLMIILSFFIEIILLITNFNRFNAQAYNQKKLDNTIAEKVYTLSENKNIKKIKNKLVWLPAYDEHFTAPTLELFYNYEKFILPAGQDYFFSKHKTVFLGNYSNLDIDKIYDNINSNINNYVDILIIFKDPKSSIIHDNRYSQEISKRLSEDIPKNKKWKFFGVIETKKYGLLNLYYNYGAKKDNYLNILSGNINFD